MKASCPALMLVTILSIASIAQAISVVLVTDDASVRAWADSDADALVRGTVSSVESKRGILEGPSGKQYAGGPPYIILHFAGVKNDHVYGTIADPTPYQHLYGQDLSGLVGKTVEMMSKAGEDNGKIYFSDKTFRVIESGSGPPEVASSPTAPPGSARSRNSATSKVPDIDANTIAKLEKLGNDGNMQAQEELGSIYFKGYGTIPKDYKKAVFWLQKAVDQNRSLKANLLLARMYENGWGVDQDSDLAYDYYESVERSSGNQALKKAIAPEWKKVQKEKQASIEASSHVDYVDAEGKLHSAGASYKHSTFSPRAVPGGASPRIPPKGLVRKSERYWDAYRTDIIRKVFDGDFGNDVDSSTEFKVLFTTYIESFSTNCPGYLPPHHEVVTVTRVTSQTNQYGSVVGREEGQPVTLQVDSRFAPYYRKYGESLTSSSSADTFANVFAVLSGKKTPGDIFAPGLDVEQFFKTETCKSAAMGQLRENLLRAATGGR